MSENMCKDAYQIQGELYMYRITLCLICSLILLILISPSFAVAGTIKGILLDDAGESVEGITVYAYSGEDPERATALPDEKSRAVYTKTDSEGNFSIDIPETLKVFTLKVLVDPTFFRNVEVKDLQNQPGIIQLEDALVQQYLNNEAFWISNDNNAAINPGTCCINTNRWEQNKARGRGIEIHFPSPKIEPLFYNIPEEKLPEIKGLPQKHN